MNLEIPRNLYDTKKGKLDPNPYQKNKRKLFKLLSVLFLWKQVQKKDTTF